MCVVLLLIKSVSFFSYESFRVHLLFMENCVYQSIKCCGVFILKSGDEIMWTHHQPSNNTFHLFRQSSLGIHLSIHNTQTIVTAIFYLTWTFFTFSPPANHFQQIRSQTHTPIHVLTRTLFASVFWRVHRICLMYCATGSFYRRAGVYLQRCYWFSLKNYSILQTSSLQHCNSQRPY